MGTNTDSEDERPGGNASRFSYLSETEPVQGGVRSVTSSSSKGPRKGRNETLSVAASAAVSGVPGPSERLLDISELARSVGMHYTHRFHIPPYPEKDIEYAGPIAGEVTLTNTGGSLLLRGHVSAPLRLECGRCLEPTEQEITADLEEEFDLVTSRNAYHQEEVQAVDEDSPAAVIAGNVLDLGDLLRQNLLLAAPVQPLCSEECPGIPVSSTATGTDAAATGVPQDSSPLRRLAELLAEKQKKEEAAGGGEP